LGFRIEGEDFAVRGSGYVFWCLGLRVYGLMFRGGCLGFMVLGPGLRAEGDGSMI